ncbi:MAG TPA: hypothetical protein VJN64_18005 [Terriglobales bacterium]|nr:hypothetical protein [Terriglobales bacterium]
MVSDAIVFKPTHALDRTGTTVIIASLKARPIYFYIAMYDDFHAVDRWTGQKLHCIYQALIVAVATRHADAVDIKFLASGRPVWIALPHPTWVEYKQHTGRTLTDPLAIQTAGHFLKTAIENGTYEHGREMYTLTVQEALAHLNAVLKDVGAPDDALVRTA